MPSSPANYLLGSQGFGFYLNQTAIRLVGVNNQRQVQFTSEVTLNPGTFTQQEIQVEELKQAVAQLLSQHPVKIEYASVTLPDYYSYSKSHQLPRIAISDVSEALAWQIESILPLPKESIYFDWQLIQKTDQATQVLVMAMPRLILDNLIEVFESLSIRPTNFEPSSSVLSRTLLPNLPTPQFLVEINNQGSSISLLESGAVALTVTNQYAITDPTQTGVVSEQLASSIQSVVGHAQSKYPVTPEEPPTAWPIFITGESANQELAQWLSQATGFQTQVLELNQLPPAFHQAYASAVSMVQPVNPDTKIVNLLPDELKQYYQATKIKRQVSKIMIIQVALILISCLLAVVSLLMAQTRVAQSSVELANINSPDSNYVYNPSEVAAINQSSQTFVRLFNVKKNPISAFNALMALSSDQIRLTNITYERDKKSILVAGFASERAALLNFVDLLKQEDGFVKVDLPLDALEKPVNISFSIRITLE